MSTPTSSSRASTWIGILLGLVILGAMAAFAIALPKAHGEETVAEPELTLPDELPGGYLAADDPKAFSGSDLEAQADDIATSQESATKYGNAVLPEVLDHAAVTRTYVVDGTSPVYVQAFHSEGGAFAPQTLQDPDDGQPTSEMKKVGDGVCILGYGQSETGGIDVVSSQCQVTRDDLTVQIEAGALEAKELVGIADDLLDDLAADD